MVHSLNTSNAPSRITGLAWHGSATRQKSDMLATQSADGNLKVWSIPKVPNGDSPNIIRILNRPDGSNIGPCWFGWSKLGRIVQHSGRETRAWDVRTKNVSFESVPTLDGIVGIANCGPTCALFTLGNDHTVQQFDIKPGEKPTQVASVRHAPANTPPSPPNSNEDQKGQDAGTVATLPTSASIPIVYTDPEVSEGEGTTMSPLQRIAQEMDHLEEERRDHVTPLSPLSSRASSVSSNRSSESGRRAPSYRYDKPGSSRASNASANDGTEFSFGQPIRQPVRESISIHTTPSFAPSRYRSSGLRKEVLRSPHEAKMVDLFPYARARLAGVAFRAPYYGSVARTPDVLRQEMLSVVFGWNEDIEMMIRDELTRHSPASTNGVLLSQWLGELGADSMASMVGSESMTSADWMLLALSSMGQGSQKKVGEAFVHRLLEKGDIHPAVAILLGLREENDAIEVYISRSYFMEAVLLTCLTFPSDWQRQSYLVRKWGEVLVAQGQPEMAVRCFSCTSVEISESWQSPYAQASATGFTPRGQRVVERRFLSPPLSPPSATESIRLRPRQGSLKLITSFGDDGVALLGSSTHNTPMPNNLGVTPIAESAISPGGPAQWVLAQRKERDPSSARTATPGGYSRKRLPSQSDRHRAPHELPRIASRETPLTAAKDFVLPIAKLATTEHSLQAHDRRKSSVSSSDTSQSYGSSDFQYGSRKASIPKRLPSPAQDVFARLKDDQNARNGSRERLSTALQVQVYDTAYMSSTDSSASDLNRATSQKGNGGRLGDVGASQEPIGHPSRAQSRQREPSENRGRVGTRYIRPSKRSPSSPVPMSPEEVAAATRAMAKQSADRVIANERFESESISAIARFRGGSRAPSRSMKPSADASQIEAGDTDRKAEVASHHHSPSPTPSIDHHGEEAAQNAAEEKPSQRYGSSGQQQDGPDIKIGESSIRSPGGERSRSIAPLERPTDSFTNAPLRGETDEALLSQSNMTDRDQGSLIRKRLAARELEERRASLARRPSAPVIPLPGESPNKRPPMVPRSHTELGDSPHSFVPPVSGIGHERSHTADPHDMMRFVPKLAAISGASPGIGLPATPRAMRHPYYMIADGKNDERPPGVPDLAPANTRQPVEPGSDADGIAPLLPGTAFSPIDTTWSQRAASVPLEKAERTAGVFHYPSNNATSPISPNRRDPTVRGHSRRTSQTDVQTTTKRNSSSSIRASIDETLHEAQVVMIEAADSGEVVLPELRHLATPPPPPPPPPMFTNPSNTNYSDLGVINIAIDDGAPPVVVDVASTADRAATTSPSSVMSAHRRDRNSASEGLGQRLRNATGMRSTSRSRAKSPLEAYKPMPYETVLPQIPTRRASISRTKASGGGTPVLSDAAVNPGVGGSVGAKPPESISLPPSRTGSAFQGRQHHKDIRANMPPETLQQGVYQPDNMI